jgi:hypothetical protein
MIRLLVIDVAASSVILHKNITFRLVKKLFFRVVEQFLWSPLYQTPVNLFDSIYIYLSNVYRAGTRTKQPLLSSWNSAFINRFLFPQDRQLPTLIPTSGVFRDMEHSAVTPASYGNTTI